MRLVLDTNTAISALLWHGTPGRLIDAAQIKTVSLFTSAPLLAELCGVLLREKFAKQLKAKSLTPGEIADGYAVLASIVTPAVIPSTIVHDPADDVVLATALAARADLVVSGDKRLRNVKNYQGIPVVTAAQALTRLAQHVASGSDST